MYAFTFHQTTLYTMQIKTLAQILAENGVKSNVQGGVDNNLNSNVDSNINKNTGTDANNKAGSKKIGEKDTKLNQPSNNEKLTADFFYDENYNQRPAVKTKLNKPKRKSNSKYPAKKANTQKKRIARKAAKLSTTTKELQKKQTQLQQPAKQKKPLDIKSILQEIKTEPDKTHSNNTQPIDNLTNKLQTGLKTAEERQQEIDDIKANGRLRWLAFYYLSTREHSAGELKKKLLAKQQDSQKIDELLAEFAQKGYQSEMRTALMLIREGIRKGRGRRRIKQDFYTRQISLPSNIDELIDLANEESDEFADFITTNDEADDKIDWLRLAVEARVKKYGSEIPKDNKDKAKQLRFLQYRGFKTDICFEALKHNLQTINV